jgi:hypothetical protein
LEIDLFFEMRLNSTPLLAELSSIQTAIEANVEPRRSANCWLRAPAR